MEKLYKSQTYGLCTFEQVMYNIAKRIEKDPKAGYLLAVGTDSQNHKQFTKYANVIMLHTLGQGGIFFYSIEKNTRIPVVTHRMLEEAHQSIDIAKDVLNWFDEAYDSEIFDFTKFNISMEIHCDIGPNGASGEAIKGVLGWIQAEFGDSFLGVIKPASAAATHISDLFVR